MRERFLSVSSENVPNVDSRSTEKTTGTSNAFKKITNSPAKA